MAETAMQKLNAMGQVPHLKNNNNGKPIQIVNVTYGHNGGGKLYSYFGQNKRAGDTVTPEVTSKNSGKTYKTLATVKSTHAVPQGMNTVDVLSKKGIKLKSIDKTDQKSLPGYYQGWDKDAKARQELKHETILRDDIPSMQKMTLLNEISRMRK